MNRRKFSKMMSLLLYRVVDVVLIVVEGAAIGRCCFELKKKNKRQQPVKVVVGLTVLVCD